MDCGFTLADSVPNEASYSRMIQKIHASSALGTIQNDLVYQAFQENRPLFEEKIEDQLPLDFATIKQQIPQVPHWGIKKNSEGKNVFWYGFKGHLLVDCKSQYILSSLLSSGNVNDGKMAILLLKALSEVHPYLKPSYVLADVGYDYTPFYKQAQNMG